MKNLQNLEFQELSKQEATEINGGAICAGLCVGIVIGVVALGAFALGVYNGYQNQKDQHAPKN